MYLQRETDGVWLHELPVWVVDTLLCLPEWIESDHPDVRKRLLPQAYQDPQQDAEWREALGDSLEHLFASRTEIVRGDLKKLEVRPPELDPDADPEDLDLDLASQTLFSVWIPAAHVAAWVSTLQAGTHALFILEGLSEEDLDGDPETIAEPEKQVSMLRLSVLQEILVRLIEGV